ncbi:hypothetical protein G6F56_000318 [Rhizopus delemar]|nr:hypothetical protein G6F56_000318 [Rhizopus delemar]
MGCCGNDKPKWKSEAISNHSFDDVDLRNFYNPSLMVRFKYFLLIMGVLKSFAVYAADLWTAVSLLVIGQTTVTPAIPTEVSKWIFFGCIMVSFLLLTWDMIKARRILITRDISYNFTCDIANTYLSLKDYQCHCLFQIIRDGIDGYAYFVFYNLKGWKRLLLAEAPRQVINIVTLQALVPEWLKFHQGRFTLHNEALGADLIQQILTVTMAFSVVIFTFSFALVCAAAVLYVFLIFHIRGNLKEYVCHKADKRIESLLRPQALNQVYPRSSSFVYPDGQRLLDNSLKSYSPQLSQKSTYFS